MRGGFLMDKDKNFNVNENGEQIKDEQNEILEERKSNKNKATFLGLLAVSAATIAASAIYTKKGIEKIEKNGK